MNKNFTMEVNGLKIDPKIFTFKFHCNCTGECCNYGVYTDLKEHDLILNISKKIINLMDDSQDTDKSKWFEPPEDDEDFDSGVAVGTEVINGKCSFLDKDGLCTLQKLAISEGEHQWKYKPIYCILFPLTIYENALTIDDEHIDRLKTCNKNPQKNLTIYEACKEELKYFLGDKDFSKLENYRMKYLDSISTNKTI